MRYLLIIKNEKGETRVAHFGRTDKSFEELVVEFTTFYSSEANLKALRKGISHCKFYNDKDTGPFLKDLLAGKKSAMEHFTKYCDPEVDFSDVQKSEKPTSRGRKSRLAEVEKSDPNHTNRSHPDFSHPDPSISPRYPPYGEMDGIDRNQVREELKENIDYEHLRSQCPYDDVGSLLELMVDVVSSTASTIRIGGEVLPLGPVKERFRQLDSSHIEYVIDSLKQTTTKINNIRAYLLTVLYNAPVTIGPYYSAAVRHDFG